MKKTLLTLTALLVAAGAFAQGTVVFNNRLTGSLITHVYAPQLADPSTRVSGNSSIDTPVGSTVYTGALLTGSGWTAQLWAAPGAGALESSLIGIPTANGGTSTFRTGGAAGNWVATTATLTAAGVAADAASATFQVRVFPTSAGSWDTALAQGLILGKSDLFTVNGIGGVVNQAPILAGLTSFSLVAVPEPSSMALAGLGAASLLIFRRRK